MRIKFEKGMTPEAIANAFVKFVRENSLVIGAVNIYMQTYDDEMKSEKLNGDDYFICRPCESTKREYTEDVARLRRRRMKAI
jgi:hypothetical protein